MLMLTLRVMLLHIGIFWLGWLIGYYVIQLMFSDSANVQNYSLLSGWWCAVYFSVHCRIGLADALPAYISYIVADLIAWMRGDLIIHYHDMPNAFNINFFFHVILMRALVFISPVFLNIGAQYVIGKLNRIINHEDTDRTN